MGEIEFSSKQKGFKSNKQRPQIFLESLNFVEKLYLMYAQCSQLPLVSNYNFLRIANPFLTSLNILVCLLLAQ